MILELFPDFAKKHCWEVETGRGEILRILECQYQKET